MLRVGIDVSPLALTQGGHGPLPDQPPGRARRRPRARAAPVRLGRDGKRDASVRARHRLVPRHAHRARRRRDGVDVCTARPCAPRSARRVPLVVTIHDVAVLRHPEAFNRWTRTYSAGRCRGSCAPRTRSSIGSEFTRDELVELPRRAGREGPRHPVRRRPAVHGRGTGRRRRLRPRRLDARAAQEPLPAGRGLPALRPRRARAARRRGRGLGRRQRRRRAGAAAGRRRRRGARAPLPRRGGGRLRLALRGLRPARARGDGLRARRSSRPRAARSASSPQGVAFEVDPLDAGLDRRRACAAASPPGLGRRRASGPPTSAGSAPCRLHVDLYRELAG